MKTNNKRKEAANDLTRQQPLKNMSEPATQRTRGKSTIGPAELQPKPMEAAKKFVGQHWEIDQSAFDIVPAPDQTYREAYEELETRVWGKHVFCTPVAVMFRLGWQWFKLTPENVATAAETLAAETLAEDQRVKPEVYAKIALRDVRQWTKRVGRVGWVLPRLEKEVA
jgi:hypothetical protein